MITELFISDVSSIVRLQVNSGFTDGWNTSMLESAFDSGNYKCYGIKNGEKLVAFIGITLSVDTADIEDVLVDVEYRNKGLGRKLLEFALEKLKQFGKTKVFLEVRESNLPAKSLYQKSGFNKISVRKNYYNGTENAVVFLKEI